MRRFVLLILLACFAVAPALAAERALPEVESTTSLKALQQKANADGHVKVIVGFKVPFAPEGQLASSARASQRRDIAAAARNLRARFSDATKRRPSAVRTYSTLPFMALEVTPAELAKLAADPLVASITENRKLRLNLAQSSQLVRAPEAWAAGFTGQGQTIAILDTGVDKTHPFLAGKVVSEACYSLGGYCPSGATSSTAPDSGLPCPQAEACAHGTHVAGIAAGKGTDASGIAKDATLIAIQVFSPDPDSREYVIAWYSDMVAGLNRVLELRGSFQIAAVNVSIGGEAYTRSCDRANRPLATAIANLRSAGIATVVSSGNEGWINALAMPSCISSAVSVGAVSDSDWGPCYEEGGPTATDKVVCYSNASSMLSLLAPGAMINSSVPGGGYESWDGTSMAAPHVAGAWALMREKYPDAPVGEVLAALQASGRPVADYRVKRRKPLVKPRIDVAAALDRITRLNVTVSGTGTGTVTITTPRGTTSCSGSCSVTVALGTVVKLSAKATKPVRFTGWSGGGCSGARACRVTMNGAQSVTATFTAR